MRRDILGSRKINGQSCLLTSKSVSINFPTIVFYIELIYSVLTFPVRPNGIIDMKSLGKNTSIYNLPYQSRTSLNVMIAVISVLIILSALLVRSFS